jgi:ketosteroid isomerase-like protein
MRWLLTLAVTLAGTLPAGAESLADLEREVRERERAFARTMADRDHKAFESFLAEEAIFLSPQATHRGRPAVALAWKALYEGPAPFSWEPERVEVLDSRTLAFSTGPVRDAQGNRIGTFHSVWRREADGKWRIILDSGCPRCTCP